MKSSIAKIIPREILFSRIFVHAKFSTFIRLAFRIVNWPWKYFLHLPIHTQLTILAQWISFFVFIGISGTGVSLQSNIKAKFKYYLYCDLQKECKNDNKVNLADNLEGATFKEVQALSASPQHETFSPTLHLSYQSIKDSNQYLKDQDGKLKLGNLAPSSDGMKGTWFVEGRKNTLSVKK